MADEPTQATPAAAGENQSQEGSAPSHASSHGLIPVRNSSDQEIKDAVDGVLNNVDVGDLIMTSRMLISLKTVQTASPIWLYFLKRLFDSKGFQYSVDYGDEFIRNVMLDVLYSDFVEAPEHPARTQSSRISSSQEPVRSIPSRNSQQVVTHPHSKPKERPPVSWHFSRAIFDPLPEIYPRGVYSRIGDLVKYYATPHSRYSGRPSEKQSLSMHHAAYYNQAKLCNLTATQALQSLINMIEPQSLASHFYFSEILEEVRTLEEAFDKLYSWDRHHSTLERTLRMWRSLKVSHFKSRDTTWSVAMEKFYERATLIQAQLDPIHTHDTHLIEVLQSGIREQPFYMFVERSESASSAHHYFQNCLSAIAKQEDIEGIVALHRADGTRMSQVSGTLVQDKLVKDSSSDIYPPESRHHSSSFSMPKAETGKIVRPSEPANVSMTQDNPVREALFSTAGRRYGRGIYPRRQGNKNPIGRNGKRMLCRGCNSDEYFIAQCPNGDKPKLIAFANELIGTDAYDYSGHEILEMIQDLPDDIWDVFMSTQVDPQAEPHETIKEVEPKEAMFVSLANSAAVHGFIRQKALNRTLGFDQSTEKVCQSSSNHSQSPRVPVNICTSSVIPNDHSTPPSVSLEDGFEGVMLDNGSSGTPSGLSAYLRYCRHVGIKPQLRPSTNSFVGIGKGVVRSLGVATIRMPLGHTFFLDFETDIITQDVPLMFGLDQHRKHGCSSDEFENSFTHHPSNTTIPVSFKKGHLYIEWPKYEVLFTKAELKKVHDRFGHLTSKSLISLLKRARPEECNAETRKALLYPEARFKACQTFAPKPAVYKVSMPMDEVVFNHEVEVDLFWIEGNAVLHIVDRGTRYSVARFVDYQSAENIWNMIIDSWVTIFTGFPNIISHDRGPQFSSEFFKDACAEFGIIAKEVPTESHYSIGLCERYHPIIRRIFRKIKHDHPGLDKSLILSLAVHAVNTTIGPEGITPSLLVFGTIPRLPIGGLHTVPPTQRERFKAMKNAREEMLAITAERRLSAALRERQSRSQPFIPKEEDLVRVYRENPERFDGPFPVHSYDQRKTVWVEARDGAGRLRIVPFSLSQTRPFIEENDIISELQNIQSEPDDMPGLIDANAVQEGSPDPFSNITPTEDALPLDAFPVEIVNNSHDERFHQAKIDELNQLLDKGTYQFVPKSEISNDAVVLDSRFVLAIKNPNSVSPTFKARFVILGHKDPDKDIIVNEAPTVLRSSVRLVVALSQAFGYPLWTRDVSQAFVQANDSLKRELYIRPPRDENVLEILGAPKGFLLKAIQPLYGLPESPSYWWSTFSAHHRTVLLMSPSVLDPCLFYRKDKNGKFEGIQAVLVDDTIGSGTKVFAADEKLTEKHFQTKPRRESFPMKFNGIDIELIDVDMKAIPFMKQHSYSNSIRNLNISVSSAEFATSREKVAYVSVSTRPDVAFLSAELAQIKTDNVTAEDTKPLHKAIQMLKSDIGLPFPKLYLNSMKIVGYSDASFAGNTDLSSQLGMFILLVDQFNNACAIHYASWKCRRVTRSVLAAEIYAFAYCLDYCLTLRYDLFSILSHRLRVELFTDSKSLFDTITKLTSLSEKRLLIDVSAIRESYHSGDLDDVAHVSSEFNMADCLTKSKESSLLVGFMETGKLKHPVNQWIVRS